MEAGADSVLEMAFTLADGLEYCRTGELVQQDRWASPDLYLEVQCVRRLRPVFHLRLCGLTGFHLRGEAPSPAQTAPKMYYLPSQDTWDSPQDKLPRWKTDLDLNSPVPLYCNPKYALPLKVQLGDGHLKGHHCMQKVTRMQLLFSQVWSTAVTRTKVCTRACTCSFFHSII